MEIYKWILYIKILVLHDEFTYDMDYNIALENVSHADDDYETNGNFKK